MTDVRRARCARFVRFLRYASSAAFFLLSVPISVSSEGGLVIAAALAQSEAPADDGSPTAVQSVNPIERGWFIEADVGVTAFVNKIEDRRYEPGPQVAVIVGYDILPILNIGVGVSLWGGELSIDDSTPRPWGDLFVLTPTFRAQFAVFTTQRNFVWLRGDVGFGFGLPGELDGVDYAGNGPVFGVTAGYERFTKLRHFAIGVHGGVVILTQPGLGIGVTVTPTIQIYLLTRRLYLLLKYPAATCRLEASRGRG